MRLSYLSGSTIPSRAANGVQVMKMCAAFAELGHDVRLYCFAGQAAPEGAHGRYGVAESFAISRYRAFADADKGARAGLFQALLRAQLARRRTDLIYSRSKAVLHHAAKLGRPFVIEAHHPPVTEAAERRFAALVSHPACLRVVTISGALGEHLLDRVPALRAEQLCVAHDGADPVAPPPPRRSGPPRVGYVGHLYPGKGMETIAALPAHDPDLAVEVYGGHEDDIARWRAKLGPDGRIRLHGHVPQSQVPAVIAGLDIVLAPYGQSVKTAHGTDTARWMSPLKIFEYMAHGKAIVAADLPVLREILRDGRNALLVPPGDAAGFAAAIARLIADPDLAARLGATARADLMARHTWRARAAQVLDGLEGRIGARAQRQAAAR